MGKWLCYISVSKVWPPSPGTNTNKMLILIKFGFDIYNRICQNTQIYIILSQSWYNPNCKIKNCQDTDSMKIAIFSPILYLQHNYHLTVISCLIWVPPEEDGLSLCWARELCLQMWQPASVQWKPEQSRPSVQNQDEGCLHLKCSHRYGATRQR